MTDKSVVNKQAALYWEDLILNEQSDSLLWNLLTDKNSRQSNNSDQTNSDDDIDDNDKFKERKLKESPSPFPTFMYNINGKNISPSDIVNIAPREGQIHVSFASEHNLEALAFPKDQSTGRNHINKEREIPATPSKYFHIRLKYCDDIFAANPLHIFPALYWIKKLLQVQFILLNENNFKNEINIGQLVNHKGARRVIFDDQILCSFKNIIGTLQYFYNMLLDVLAKTR